MKRSPDQLNERLTEKETADHSRDLHMTAPEVAEMMNTSVSHVSSVCCRFKRDLALSLLGTQYDKFIPDTYRKL